MDSRGGPNGLSVRTVATAMPNQTCVAVREFRLSPCANRPPEIPLNERDLAHAERRSRILCQARLRVDIQVVSIRRTDGGRCHSSRAIAAPIRAARCIEEPFQFGPLSCAGLRIRAEEVFDDFVLLVFFGAAVRDLGADANAKVAGAVGPACTS